MNSKALSKIKVFRGEIYYADLGVGEGSEQQGIRPVLIIQNDKGNKTGPTTIVAAITKQNKNKWLPIHQKLDKSLTHLEYDSVVLFEQIRVISKSRLRERIATLRNHPVIMNEINGKLMISLGL